MNFADLFSATLGAPQMAALSQAVGANTAQTESAIGAMVPLLVSAMARNARSTEGAQALADALDRDHDGGIMTQIPHLLQQPEAFQGDGILGHILGGKREVAQAAVSQSSGLSLASTGKLFAIVAPIVLGMIGAKKRQEGFGADILASMLNGFANQHENEGPTNGDGGLLGTLGGMMASQATGDGGGLLGTIGSMVAGAAGSSNTPSNGGTGSFISAILDRDHDGSTMIGSFLTNRK